MKPVEVFSRPPRRRHGAPGSIQSPFLRTALLAVVLLLTACGAASRTALAPTSHTPTAAVHQFTYVALSASDGYGIGTDDPDRDNWPSVLSGDLGRPVHLVNLGIPATTAGQAIKTELPVALDAQPDLITVWLAANDFADGVPLETYSHQLHSLLASLRQGTHARMFVGNLPNLALLPRFEGMDAAALEAQVRAWNSAIAGDSRDEGATLVDLYAGWTELARHPEYISSDGFHPSTAGAERLAEIFLAAIRQSGAA
jgi:lysophospholipase L1-like esterase